MQLWVDIIGWFGVALMLVAFLMVSNRRLQGDSIPYQWMNLIGAICLMVNSYYYRAFPSVIVNLVWSSIAVITVIRVRMAKAGQKSDP